MVGRIIPCWEVGTVGDVKVIPEVARIEWGWGWYSLYPSVPGRGDVTIVWGNEAVWIACTQLILYVLLGEIVL